MMTIIIKSIVIVLLLLCLLPMPHIYYSIVRWAVAIAMFNLSVVNNPEMNFGKALIYIVVGVLFNPFFIIEFPRLVWNIIDVLTAIVMLNMAFMAYKKEYVD